ncbi:MAG: dUTP diphosphatase [Acidimicrobiales bacterium]
MEIPTRPLHDGAVVPRYAHAGDAGVDLTALVGCTLAPRGGRALVGTGLSVAIPVGYAGLVLPRSGLATRHGVTCVNAPGLIDAGYRGEIKVALVNLDPAEEYRVRAGERIAQLVIVAVATATFTLAATLEDSSRAEGGFGSSGR